MIGCGLISREDLYFLTVHCICDHIHNRVWGVCICGLDTVITSGFHASNFVKVGQNITLCA
jgi:hypothetical protein